MPTSHTPRSILVVCLGNICRSPILEALLKIGAAKENLSLKIESRGTNRYHKGEGADPRAISVCRNHEVDLSSHVARRITEEDLIRFDWILTLAPEIDDELWELPWMDEKYRTKIRTLEGLSLELGISLPREIQDPWYGGPQDFEKCFQTLKHTAQALVTSMKQITNGKV